MLPGQTLGSRTHAGWSAIITLLLHYTDLGQLCNKGLLQPTQRMEYTVTYKNPSACPPGRFVQMMASACPALGHIHNSETTAWSWIHKPYFRAVTKLSQPLSTSPLFRALYGAPFTFVVTSICTFIMTLFWQVTGEVLKKEQQKDHVN